MLSKTAQLALIDIRDNILSAQKFTNGLSRNQFIDSQLHFYAVTRALEIISEASRRLPDDFRVKHSSLPWKQIMGVGNIYRHEYNNVEHDLVWETVKEHLAPLFKIVTDEISAFEHFSA